MRIVWRLLGMAIAYVIASAVSGDGTLDPQTLSTIRAASLPIGWVLASLLTPREAILPDDPPSRLVIGGPSTYHYCPHCGRGNDPERTACWNCREELS